MVNGITYFFENISKQTLPSSLKLTHTLRHTLTISEKPASDFMEILMQTKIREMLSNPFLTIGINTAYFLFIQFMFSSLQFIQMVFSRHFPTFYFIHNISCFLKSGSIFVSHSFRFLCVSMVFFGANSQSCHFDNNKRLHNWLMTRFPISVSHSSPFYISLTLFPIERCNKRNGFGFECVSATQIMVLCQP